MNNKDARAWYQGWMAVRRGGPGSGNWGHAGRKGQRGGSLPKSIAMSLATGPTAQERQEASKGNKTFGTSPVTDTAKLSWKEQGINQSAVLTFEDGTRAIFKPFPMEVGTIESEVMAYEISKALGWDIVPETIQFEHEGKGGSLQKWVENAQTGWEYMTGGKSIPFIARPETIKGTPQMQRDFDRMKALDDLINNTDRHENNWIVTSDGRVRAIDNGASFGGWMYSGRNDPKWYEPKIRASPAGEEIRAWMQTPAFSQFTTMITSWLGAEFAQKLEALA